MVFESINKNGHRNRKIINNVKEVLLDSASFHVAIKGQTKTLNDSTFSTLLSLVKSVENDRSIKPEEKLNRSLSLMISFGNGQFQGSQQGHFAHVINELFKIKHKNGEYCEFAN